MTFICFKCKLEKSIAEFHPRKDSKSGYRKSCKLCHNKSKLISSRLYSRNNRQRLKIRELAWKRANKKRVTGYSLASGKKYPDRRNARTAKYFANKKKRTPSWITKAHLKEIEEFYSLAKELQWLSEEKLTVDHIVPLCGKNVSGLHVPWNLQILPVSMNCKKNNIFLTQHGQR